MKQPLIFATLGLLGLVSLPGGPRAVAAADSATIAELLAQDRHKLLLRHPFTGAVVMRLDLRVEPAAVEVEQLVHRRAEIGRQPRQRLDIRRGRARLPARAR